MQKRIIAFVWFLLLSAGMYAQTYLNFVENKGQWDPSIRFKTEMPGGAIVLKNTGYRVLQYNSDDYAQLTEALHALKGKDVHSEIEKMEINGKQVPVGDVGTEIQLRSHTYEVKFLNGNPNPTIVS